MEALPKEDHQVVLAALAPVVRAPVVLARVILAQAVAVKVLLALVLALVPEIVAVHLVAIRAREVVVRTRSNLVSGAWTQVRRAGDVKW